MLLLNGTGQEPCPMMALAPAVLVIWVLLTVFIVW